MKIELYMGPKFMGCTKRYWIAIDGVFKYFRGEDDIKYKNWIKLNRYEDTDKRDDDIYKVKDLTEEDLMLELL